MSVKNIFKTTRANDLESVGEVREVSLTADESQVEFEHNGIEYTLVRDDSGVCTLSSAFVSGLGRFKCSKFPERIVLGEFSNHLHEEIGIQVDGGSLLLGIPSTNKRSYEVFLNIHNRDIPYEEYTMQRNTGKLFRMGQEDGENGILEGGTQNKEKLLQGLKETLEKKRIFLSEEDIESLVTDSDHDGLYEIDTNILGKNLFLYLRRELNMRQFVDATKTSALSERQIEGLRANIATELSKILKSPISKPNKDRLVDALRELIKTKQFKRYAELKQKYMRAHYAHIGNKGDAYESFKVNQEMMLPTIYDGGIHPPIKIGDCNVLASISRDIDKRAGATQTQYISINVTHNKGEPGSHRLLSSRLGKDTYLISDNCYQILVPTKLIGKFGFAEARKIMILLLRPNQINRSNKPILSFSLMKRYLDEYADMANYDPDHLRRGFAEAHMFRLQRRLEKTKVTFTNLEKLLRQAEKLYNEYPLDDRSRSYTLKRAETLLIDAINGQLDGSHEGIVDNSQTANAKGWPRILDALKWGLSWKIRNNVRNSFVSALIVEQGSELLHGSNNIQALIRNITVAKEILETNHDLLDGITKERLKERLEMILERNLNGNPFLSKEIKNKNFPEILELITTAKNFSSSYHYHVLNNIAYQFALRVKYPPPECPGDPSILTKSKYDKILSEFETLVKDIPDDGSKLHIRYTFFRRLAHYRIPY